MVWSSRLSNSNHLPSSVISMAYTIPAAQVSVPTSSKHAIEAKLVDSFPGPFIGAMPVHRFLDLLPKADGLPVIANLKGEEEFWPILRKFTTNLDFVETSSCPDPSVVVGGYEFQPDVALYNSGSTRNGVTDMSAMEAWIIVKPSMDQDPFDDPELNEDFNATCSCTEEDPLPCSNYRRYHQFESSDKQCISTRAHMVACTNAFFATQFRRFGFSILLCGSWARFVYWDRSGAVVSRRFDYKMDFTPLAEFLWRLNCASSGARGVDVSVLPVTLPEIQDSSVRELLGLGSSEPLYGFIVPIDTALQNSKDAEGRPLPTHHFYVGPRPAFQQCSLREQRSRAFPVWDIQQKRVVFFKESWRYEAITSETEMYRELHSRRISNIPTFEHGGDMSAFGARTNTHLFNHAWWSCTRNRKARRTLIQHRIILLGVERTLNKFKSSEEFLIVMRDAVKAHQEAYESHGLLHRNISMENIGITSDGRGLLMGWECCAFISRGGLWETQMGTLPFMSAALLAESAKKNRHVLEDDLESFLHVMMYTLVRYFPSKMNAEERNAFFQIFEEGYVVDEGGRAIGGSRKRECLRNLGSYIPKNFTPPYEIARLLRELCGLFPVRYDSYLQLVDRHTDPRFLTRGDLLSSHKEMIQHFNISIPDCDEYPDMSIDDCLTVIPRYRF
ncbi:hypothetical protein EDB19DRAFT_443028 [Suillus lakei]|nr:hypothetical protein EDB19DRAFT_443028 [Suillus lakei]